MTRSIRFAIGLAAVLLALASAPPAAQALEFESTVPDQTFTVGTAVSLTLPRTKLEGQCYHNGSSYTLTPTLPAGLSFNGDYNSRLISGTPTTATAQTQYTYSASNNACYQNTSANFNITVVTAPDITLSASSVSVTEGGTGTYTVRLKDQPTGNVTVTVSSGDSGAVTASPASLTFTTGNYSTTQTVTLTGAQDADGADETVTITHTASGGGITGETATLTATVTDDDSLTAGSIGETSAILTNYKGSWYYKETAPSTGTCSSAGAGVSVNLTGLTAGTSYTYKAYSDSNCATETGSVTFSTLAQTTVPKMATPTLTGGAKQISLSWSYPQGVPGLQAYRVRYREKGQTGWTYADARSDSGEQNFYGHETGATIPAHETFTMKDSTTYEVQVRAGKWDGNYTGWGAWSDTAEAATDPPAPYFTYWNIEWTGAEIKLHNYTSSWYYKETAPGDGSCTAAPSHTDGTTAVTLTGLQQETPYTYKAYSDSNCSDDNLIATASFTTLPGKVTGVKVTPRDQALAVSWTARNHVLHYWVEWKSGNQNYDSSRRQTVTSNSTTIGSLVNGTTYSVRVAAFTSPSGGGFYSDAVTGTPVAAPALSAGSIEATTATLTLSNHSAAWYYKYTSPSGGQCSAEISAGTGTANVTGLDAGTTYTFKAYSDSGCATELATASDFITKPGQVTGVSATAGDRSLSVSWSAVTGAASYKVQWKSGTQEYGSSREATPTGTTHTIPSLTNNTQYTLRVAAVNASGDGAWSADATGTPAVVTLTFSNATATSVRLNLANYTGVWHWKYTSPAGGQCSTAIDTGTSDDSYADATGLDAGTTYTFSVYADSVCSTALITGSVITEPPKVAGVQATAGTASLTLSWTAATGAADYVVQWKSGNQDWDSDSRQQVATSNSATLSPLVSGTAYTVRVAARNSSGWGVWSDTATGTPTGPTLAASNVQTTTATLTISGHSNAAWYYKYTVPATPAGSCSSVVASGTTTASLTGLTQGTTYTFAAYSDSTCTTANLLATASSFLTKPGQVTGVAVNALSGKLEVTWSDMERADSYKVQWKCGTQEYDSSRQASTTGGSTNKYTVSNLTNNTTCTVRVAAVNASGDGAWSAEVTGMPTPVTLSAGSVTTTTATLTIAHHTGDWYYKHTSPTGGQCSAAQTGASASVADLNQNTSYTFAAYSDSNCSTLLATAAAFTTQAVKVTGVLVNALNTGLRVSWNAVEGAASYKVQWKSGNQNYGSSRQDTATGTQHSITGLTNDTIYTVRVAAVIGGSDSAWSDDATEAPSSVYLSAGTVTQTTATLTLGGRTGNWWYTKDGGTTPPCLNTGISGATLSLTDLSAGTEYTIRAFSNSNCGPPTTAYLTEVTFRTAAAVALNASSVEATTATLTIANHTGNWYYKYTVPATPAGSCSSVVASGTTTASLTGLAANTNHTFKAYSDSGCTTELTGASTDADFLTKPGKPTTPAAATSVGSGKLTVTASVTGSGTLSKWQYQQKAGGNYGSWQDISSTSTSLSHTVSGLTNGTDYQFKVRAVNATGDGATSDASTAARPVAVTLGVSSKSATAATLTLGGYAGNWWWTKDEESNCSNTGISGNTLSLSNLTKNTSYTIHAWPNSNCGPTSIRLAQHTFTTLASDATLAGSSVEADTATLTISNYTDAWYYKYTAPSGGECSSEIAAGTSTASLTGLAGNTNHTFKAYSNSGCTTELTGDSTDAEFLTKPGKPAKPVAAAGAGSGKLTITASVTGDGTLSNWQYQQKEGSNNYGSWTDISSTSTSLSHTVSGLTDGTNYQYKVRAVNTTGNGAASDASTAAAPAAPTLAGSSVEATTATLAISNWTGDWYYKYTSPSGGDCSASAVSTTTTNLTGLSSNTSYTFKAYSDSGCSTTALATASSFLTKPGKPTTPAAATNVGSGKLTITASVTGSGTLSNWQYQQKEGSNNFGSWTNISSTSTSLSHTVSGLTDGTDYQYKVRAVNATGDGAASDASTAAQPAAPTLAGSSVEATTATLTVGNWTGSWYYKYTAPSGGDCSASAVSATTKDLTGLSTNTDYTYKAYSDSGCSTLLATASSFLTKPGKPTKPVAASGGGSGKLTITASVTGSGTLSNWQYQQKEGGGNFGSWTDISSTSTSLSHTVSGLTNGTDYQFKVRAVNATGAGAASDASDAAQPRDETLTVSNVEATTATLAIGNHPANWYYKANAAPHASCSSAVSTTSVDLTGLSTNTNYTYKAYSDSGCTTELVTATLLTKPGKPTKPVAAVGAGSGKLTITASVTGDGTLSNWQYQQKEGGGNYGSWTDISSTSTSLSHTVSGLTNGTNYQYKVRAVNATGDGATSDASTAARPAAATLAGSSVEATTATLTIGNWTGDWYYKYTSPSGGDCSASAVSATTKDIADLSSNTSYIFKAYSDSGCSTLLATASSFLTKPGKPTKPSAGSGAGSGKLTFKTSVTGDGTLRKWQYQQKKGNGNFGSWIDISSTSTTLFHTVSGLTDRADYQFKVRAVNATGTGAASDASDAVQPRALTLAASSVEATTATLVLGNWTSNWYYKYTAPSGGTCSTNAVSGTTEDLTGLATNTNYTFKAYSDSGCSTTALVTAPSFLTKPGKPTKPVAAVGAGSGKLTITASVTGDGTPSKWQYQQKEGSGNYGSWTNISSTSTSLSHTVSGLTNRTDYRFKVRAVNATGDGAESDESSPVQVPDVPPAPSKPTAAVTGGGTSVELNWTMQNDSGAPVTTWQYVKKAGGNAWEASWTTMDGIDGSTTTFTVTGLSPNTSYLFKVRGVNITGPGAESPASDAVQTSSSGPGGGGGGGTSATPSAPTALAAAAGDGLATLTWTPGDAGGLRINEYQYRQREAGGGWGAWTDICTVDDDDCATRTGHTVTGLTNGTTYTFQVRSVNALGAGEASAESNEVIPSAGASVPTFGGADGVVVTVPDQVFTPNAPIEPLVLPAATGGDHGLTYALSPAPPAGLSFDPATRTLSGTPTAAQPATLYTWSAMDVDGDTAYLTFTIEVRAEVKDLAPSFGAERIPDLVLRANQVMEPMVLPAATGGDGELTYALSPELPAGLSFDPATRVLSGLPTEPVAARAYEYTATDSDVSEPDVAALTFMIEVEDRAPDFGSERVPDLVLRANQVMEPLVLPEATGGDGELTYALSPELPAGLSFDPATRVLSGLPTEPVAARAYEYTATDSDAVEPDVAALTFIIEVADLAPDFGSRTIPDLSLIRGQVIEPLVLPVAGGGDGELTYSLSGELPAGLDFDPASRVLSGLPTEVTERRSFEYTVVDSDRLEPDAAALTFTIEVTYSAADKAILNDALAAQGRALLTNTAGAIGERFRTPAAAPAAAATADRDDEDRAVAALNSLAMWLANRYGGVPPAGGAYPGAGGAAGGLPPIAGGTAPHGFGGAGAPMPGIGAGAGFGTATGPGVGAGAGFGTGSGAGLGAGTGFTGAGSSFAGAGSFGAGGSFGPSGPPPGADRPRDWNLDQLLQGRSFAIPLFAANDGAGSGNGGDGNNSDGNGDGAGGDGTGVGGDNGYAPPSRWTLWGAATAQNFDGASEAGRFQGGVTSMFLGADARLGGDWLAGAAISGSAGESDYTVDGREGRLETELAAFHPYIRGQFGSGLEVWALGGVGSGEAMDLSGPAGAAAATGETADLEMSMAAAGLRQPLNRRGPVEFSLVGGVGAVSLTTVEGDGLRAVDGLQADITQGRLGLEIAGRGAVSPYLRLGARADGGDGRTGTGAEAVAGLRASSARVEFEAQARWLGAYSEAEFLQEGQDPEEAAYEEYGGMMRLIIKARPDGSGLQLTLSPTWGQMGGGTMLGGGGGLLGGPGGGALPLSGAGAMPGLGGGKADLSALTLESEFGYGFAFDRGLLVLGGAHGRNGAMVRETVGLSWKSADRDPESKAGGSLQFTLGYDLPTPVEAGSPRLELIYSARF